MTEAELRSAPLSEVFSYLTGRKESKQYGDEHVFLCPFHPDTDPSCFVNDRKNCWHCFGCEAKGNRYDLFKELGVHVHSHNNADKFPLRANTHIGKVQKVIDALRTLARLNEARELETCATKFQVRRCQSCKQTFITTYHCDSRLCPLCNERHVLRFFHKHKETLNFGLEIWGITLALPGRPLSNNGKSPKANLKALFEEARKTLAELRRKYQPFGLFQHAIVVRQLKIKHQVAYLKSRLLMDATRKEVEILRAYWANHYHWSPVRTIREFWTVGEGIEWLLPKASNPLEEWETPEDLEIWLEATAHTPLIYGLGNFRKVKGGRGKTKEKKQNREPVNCPFCGSTDTAFIGLIRKEEAWLWDKRFPRPSYTTANTT